MYPPNAWHNLSRSTLYVLIGQGKIEAVKSGDRVFTMEEGRVGFGGTGGDRSR
jgi:hypothetical protein